MHLNRWRHRILQLLLAWFPHIAWHRTWDHISALFSIKQGDGTCSPHYHWTCLCTTAWNWPTSLNVVWSCINDYIPEPICIQCEESISHTIRTMAQHKTQYLPPTTLWLHCICQNPSRIWRWPKQTWTLISEVNNDWVFWMWHLPICIIPWCDKYFVPETFCLRRAWVIRHCLLQARGRYMRYHLKNQPWLQWFLNIQRSTLQNHQIP